MPHPKFVQENRVARQRDTCTGTNVDDVYKGPSPECKLYVADDETKSITGPSDHEIDLLEPLFENGKLLRETSLAEIRAMIVEQG